MAQVCIDEQVERVQMLHTAFFMLFAVVELAAVAQNVVAYDTTLTAFAPGL